MNEQQKVRIDKWLWAARFFKTRVLASDAVDGGRVHVNEQRVKRSRAVRIGDHIEVWRGPDRYLVVVEGLSSRRGPAREAQLLYKETTESIESREKAAAMRKLEFAASRPSRHRPSGRDRQKIRSFTGKG
ncbi:MAG TPA: RNA-binding S4 domain-containing protein [Gammaproteobacteria bacterium]|nr:RNA-binding S4 domain-containing protein [Gammaproteobacteria bacterium]